MAREAALAASWALFVDPMALRLLRLFVAVSLVAPLLPAHGFPQTVRGLDPSAPSLRERLSEQAVIEPVRFDGHEPPIPTPLLFSVTNVHAYEAAHTGPSRRAFLRAAISGFVAALSIDPLSAQSKPREELRKIIGELFDPKTRDSARQRLIAYDANRASDRKLKTDLLRYLLWAYGAVPENDTIGKPLLRDLINVRLERDGVAVLVDLLGAPIYRTVKAEAWRITAELFRGRRFPLDLVPGLLDLWIEGVQNVETEESAKPFLESLLAPASPFAGQAREAIVQARHLARLRNDEKAVTRLTNSLHSPNPEPRAARAEPTLSRPLIPERYPYAEEEQKILNYLKQLETSKERMDPASIQYVVTLLFNLDAHLQEAAYDFLENFIWTQRPDLRSVYMLFAAQHPGQIPLNVLMDAMTSRVDHEAVRSVISRFYADPSEISPYKLTLDMVENVLAAVTDPTNASRGVFTAVTNPAQAALSARVTSLQNGKPQVVVDYKGDGTAVSVIQFNLMLPPGVEIINAQIGPAAPTGVVVYDKLGDAFRVSIVVRSDPMGLRDGVVTILDLALPIDVDPADMQATVTHYDGMDINSRHMSIKEPVLPAILRGPLSPELREGLIAAPIAADWHGRTNDSKIAREIVSLILNQPNRRRVNELVYAVLATTLDPLVYQELWSWRSRPVVRQTPRNPAGPILAASA